MHMKKIDTDKAPQAIGPYSQAVLAHGFLFISGQIPINPASGKVEEATIEGQARQVFANLKAILHAAGLSFDHVVRSEVYLKDLAHFPVMNQIYTEFFTGAVKPARQAMQVAKLPLDVLIEISCIAVCKISQA
jgi:2-iminobutanoate/2-iminopropanoate deaminase